MEFLQTVFFFLLTIGILVSIHECGHFLAARASGVKVLRFAIGFGRPIYRAQWRDDTEFVIAAIPLGGYVRMLDEREGDVPPELAARAFNRLSPWWRILIAVAGPFANLVLAAFAYWLVFMVGIRDLPSEFAAPAPNSIAAQAGLPGDAEIVAVDGERVAGLSDMMRALSNRLGETGVLHLTARVEGGAERDYALRLQAWQKGVKDPDMFGSLGLRPGFSVGEVAPGSAAAAAGLRSGDVIREIDGKPIEGWEAFHTTIRGAAGRTLQVTVRRGDERVLLQLTPSTQRDEAGKVFGLAGVGQRFVATAYGPLAAIPLAVQRTAHDVAMTFGFVGKIVTGLVSSSNLSGPLTMAQIASASADIGYEYYVSVLALLSVSLAVLNILPVPVLDGGHVVYASIELITGRSVPERIQMLGLQVGVFLVASLTLLALYNDVVRLLPSAAN